MIDLPQALLTHLLQQPHTTAIATTRHKLTPHLSNTLQSLPRHESSSAIPAKLDLAAEHDAAVVVRGLMIFGGVTQVDAVVLDVSTLGSGSGSASASASASVLKEGVLRLLLHFQIVQAFGARLIILGSDRLEHSMVQMVDSMPLSCYGWTKVVVPAVDHGYVLLFLSVCLFVCIQNTVLRTLYSAQSICC